MNASAWSLLPLLRGEPLADRSWRGVARVGVAGAGLVALYGMAMGSFGGLADGRAWMALFAALKSPLLLFATFALCLPPFYVFNTLLGLAGDFPATLRALAAAQATMAAVLASLAPFTLLWYASSADYHWAVQANGVAFALASGAGQWALRRGYRPLIAVRPKHRWALGGWLTVYVFVAVQLAWTLRPFVGDPTTPVSFFRAGAFTNAYVELFESLTR